ncbi:hypothetical protein RB195_009854 [Necator americanus]|uniref:Uncharacterized protein n=1 Tax=Necator americanus TaxID=51031 RepID=A0ABR1CV90_NECAM
MAPNVNTTNLLLCYVADGLLPQVMRELQRQENSWAKCSLGRARFLPVALPSDRKSTSLTASFQVLRFTKVHAHLCKGTSEPLEASDHNSANSDAASSDKDNPPCHPTLRT